MTAEGHPLNERTIAALRAWLGSDRGRTRTRYVIVSGATLVAGQLVLAASFGIGRLSAVASNLVAFVVATLLAFVLHRRWTWSREGRSRFVGEIVPFWAIAVVGLAASTAAVRLAAQSVRGMGVSRVTETTFVMAAAVAAYGVLWVGKFVIFDRFLFRHR